MGIQYDFSDFRLTQFNAAAHARLPKALAAGIAVVHAFATPNVPIGETGNLVGSGEIKVIGMTASLTYGGPYARYQEFGVYFRKPDRYGAPLTHTHGTSFFLTGAVTQSREQSQAEFGRVFMGKE